MNVRKGIDGGASCQKKEIRAVMAAGVCGEFILVERLEDVAVAPMTIFQKNDDQSGKTFNGGGVSKKRFPSAGT